MVVVINHKICDRGGLACPAVKACPNGALGADEHGLITVDESKCTGCGLCVKACPARAILFALDKKGLAELQEAVDKDPREEKDLFRERFNCGPQSIEISLLPNTFDQAISEGIVAVEFWMPKTVSRCMNNTISYDEIFPENVRVYKLNMDDFPEIADKYGVSTPPCIVIFKNGTVIGKVVGCSSIADKEVLIRRISEILD